ncbi:DUF5333 domain-containing protein [Roseinatronobacter alkalisoli]|uniref:DUF5333 domain-containing protein n=1 Tax=Roseinatronobacter alkalisoli TaxID=3028235 RepID=A0ABT5T4U0_9RHOB|nr:DUF5333 domain-containing protein [Roseinatronobacter sp. HJB301]MDD7970133.1 DUF5333 domain-containing protein [Roseinatronobacter sp. HJB301]
MKYLVSRGVTAKSALAALGIALVLASPVRADAMPQADVNAALRGNAEIYNGLFTAALLKHIVDTCPDLQGPNRLQRVSFFMGLYNRARGMGFTRAQIEAFVDDKTEQQRLQGVVDGYLTQAGVDPSNTQAVCTYARAEMADRSALGRRLRER